MKNIIKSIRDALAARDAAVQTQATSTRAEYLAIIRRAVADQAKPADADKLLELIDALGIDTTQVDADIDLLTQAAKLATASADFAKLRDARAVVADQWRATVKRCEAEVHGAFLAKLDAEARLTQAGEAALELENLERNNPELFG